MKGCDVLQSNSVAERADIPTQSQRVELFRETPLEVAERWVLGTAWALKPARIGTLPALGALWLKDLISPVRGLPDPERTVHPGGLCGIVHDLSVPTLIEAHKRGLFTLAHFGPFKWISPPDRCVLFFDEFHAGKTVQRLIRQGRYTVTFDRAFEQVIKACAGRRENKWHLTWIRPQIMRAYTDLHDAGYAHSFEVWNAEGKLAGGGYGVAIGRAYVTESQFFREPNASKIGFSILNRHLEKWGYLFNDCKRPTPTLTEMGFREIPRRDFLDLLKVAVEQPGKSGRWDVEPALEGRQHGEQAGAQRTAAARKSKPSKAA